MPKLSESSQEVVVVARLVDIGSTVAAGSDLILVETDKVEVAVPSPVNGTVVAFLVDKGDEVETGDPICVIDT
jgi:pyruvate/2-oxoglutarate dehydrogenase complex dihydrolipoamide acyltransferase (E2) component